MARPEKKTVDYFPHVTTHGKTLFIFQRKYKNDGYAFIFKLFEALGNADYHFLDLNDVVTWEYFLADLLVDEETALEMFALASTLGMIDKDFWTHKVAYSQKFCDGIMDAYSRRIDNKPSMERVSAYINEVIGVKVDTKKGKGKETKPKETKGKYGQLDNVRLTLKEFDKLTNDLTTTVLDDYIERLSLYIPNKEGSPYKDHNAVIRSWWNKDKKDGKIKITQQPTGKKFDDI